MSTQRIFEGRHVLISGGLGDIGMAIAKRFCAAGANVSIGDILPETEATRLLQSWDKEYIRYDQVDIRDEQSVKNWVVGAVSRFGAPWCAVPNAAVVTVKPERELTGEDWRNDLDVNLMGAIYLSREAIRSMLDAGVKGCVVMIGSWAGHRVHLNMAPYSVSKAALRMFCQCLAREYAGQGIRVNEVAPGYVDAGLSGKIFRKEPAVREQALERVPNGQLITADEVAEQVVQVCRDENRHMTGSTILMDGGLSLL
jgi:glucose 1-dehydrogenase